MAKIRGRSGQLASFDFDQHVKLFLQKARDSRRQIESFDSATGRQSTARPVLNRSSQRTAAAFGSSHWDQIAVELRKAREKHPFAPHDETETPIIDIFQQLGSRFEQMQGTLIQEFSPENEFKLLEAKLAFAKANVLLQRLYFSLAQQTARYPADMVAAKRDVASAQYQVIKTSYELAKVKRIVHGEFPQQASASVCTLAVTQIRTGADLARELRAIRMEVERLAANQIIPKAVIKPAVNALTAAVRSTAELAVNDSHTRQQSQVLWQELREGVFTIQKLVKTFPVLKELNLDKWAISLWSLAQLCLH